MLLKVFWTALVWRRCCLRAFTSSPASCIRSCSAVRNLIAWSISVVMSCWPVLRRLDLPLAVSALAVAVAGGLAVGVRVGFAHGFALSFRSWVSGVGKWTWTRMPRPWATRCGWHRHWAAMAAPGSKGIQTSLRLSAWPSKAASAP